MKKTSLLLLLVPLILASCNKGPTPDPEGPDEVTVNLKGIISGGPTEGYNLRFKFNNDVFDTSAKTFSDELKMMSFASSLASSSEEISQRMFLKMGFDTYTSHLPTPSKDSVGYVMAHLEREDYDVVALSIRGFDYGEEWANNFAIGETDYHEGFYARATEIYEILEDYASNYDGKTKYWITGYSRGGGIANVLASYIFTHTDNVDEYENDIFVYTFEAPCGVPVEDSVEYPNVFNMINDLDFITKLAPAQYGLTRCGIDKIINKDKDVDALLKAFDPNLLITPFSPYEDLYEDEYKYIDFIMNQLMQKVDEEDADLSTREGFFNNYQTDIGFILGLYFTLSQSTVDKILAALSELETTAIIAMILDSEGFYNLVKPILDEDGVEYDDAGLYQASATLSKLLVAKSGLVMIAGLNEDFRHNAMRMIYMHSPETQYVLLK